MVNNDTTRYRGTRKSNRRSVQKGGVLTVEDAKRKIQEQIDEEKDLLEKRKQPYAGSPGIRSKKVSVRRVFKLAGGNRAAPANIGFFTYWSIPAG